MVLILNGEITEKSIAFVIDKSFLTAKYLYKLLKFIKEYENKTPGLKSVKNIIGDNAHISTSEIDKNIVLKDFDKIARKYGVKFAVVRKEDNKMILFFKSKDTEVLKKAIEEYTRLCLKKELKSQNKQKSKEKVKNSIIKKLNNENIQRNKGITLKKIKDEIQRC